MATASYHSNLDLEKILTSPTILDHHHLSNLNTPLKSSKITAMTIRNDGNVWCDCPKFHAAPVSLHTRHRHHKAAGILDTPDPTPIFPPHIQRQLPMAEGMRTISEIPIYRQLYCGLQSGGFIEFFDALHASPGLRTSLSYDVSSVTEIGTCNFDRHIAWSWISRNGVDGPSTYIVHGVVFWHVLPERSQAFACLQIHHTWPLASPPWYSELGFSFVLLAIPRGIHYPYVLCANWDRNVCVVNLSEQ